MRRFILAFMLLCLGQVVYAQDLIVKKSGEVITVYNVDIAEKWIYYTAEASADSDLRRLSREEIFSVKIGNGEMQMLNDMHINDDARDRSQSPKNIVPSLKVRPTASNNGELISIYNNPILTGFKKMKPSEKSMSRIFTVIKIGNESVLSNEDIEVSIEKIIDDKLVDWIAGYHIYLRNKTNSVIYVDLGNTFRIMNNGTSKVYYDGTQVTETKGKASGVGVNLGAIAAGAGVGGPVGTIANGINVGGGSQKSASQTFGNQRILAIPPMAKISLPPIFRPTKKEVVEDYDTFKMHLPQDMFQISKCQIVNYKETESPWRNQFMVTYSHEADFSTYYDVKFSLYLAQLVGVPNASFAYLMHFEDEIIGYEPHMIISHAKVVNNIRELKEVKHIDYDEAIPETIYF